MRRGALIQLIGVRPNVDEGALVEAVTAVHTLLTGRVSIFTKHMYLGEKGDGRWAEARHGRGRNSKRERTG